MSETDKEESGGLRATLKMVTKGGYEVLLTIPFDTSNKDIVKMLETIVATDDLGKNEGMTAPVRGSFAKKEATPKDYTGALCPLDSGKLYRLTTKNGKKMLKCDKSTFINGVAGGCTFIQWLNDAPQPTQPAGNDVPMPSEEDFIA